MNSLLSGKAVGRAALALTATALLATAAHADTPPGYNGPASPVSYFGTQLATTGSQTITTSSFSASLTASVFQDTARGGLLDFVYQFTDNSGDAIESLAAGDFSGFLVNAGYSAVAGDVAPSSLYRSSDGNVLHFNFGGSGNVANGQTSDYLVIQTNATAFTQGTVGLQDGTTGNGKAFKPISAAPEPGVWLLMLGGVALMGAALRQSRRRLGAMVGAA